MRSSVFIVATLLIGFSAQHSGVSCCAEATRVNEQQRIERLIRRLGAPHYMERQRAEAELRFLGPKAVDQLLDAQYDELHEIRLAARQILNSLAINWIRPEEASIVAQILRDYDGLSFDQRIANADWLAKLEDGIGFAAVIRIARYEPSEQISKLAVLSLMENFDETQTEHIKKLAEALEPVEDSVRTPVLWLRAFQEDVVAQKDLNTDLTSQQSRLRTWQKLAATENSLKDTSRTTSQISTAITQRVAKLALDFSADNEQHAGVANATIAQLVELYKDDPGQIVSLGGWLIDEDRIPTFRETIWERFTDLRKDHPQFVYLGAEAFRNSDAELSQKLAEEAFNIHEDKDDKDEDADEPAGEFLDPLVVSFARINTAIALENRGQTEWAIREYRRLMDSELEHWRIAIVKEQAAIIVAELLHDRGRDEEAANALATLMGKESINLFGEEDGDAESTESRMYYFRSEHYRKESEREKQIEFLRKAIKADPTDADVLIAMYRLPRADDEWKRETKRLIAKAVQIFETKLQRERAAGEIRNRAAIAKHLNQIAWLVSNTEGDLKKAVEQSRRSLELRPHSPGSLDTLGRTYFAVGDVANAVKYQRRAAKLEPFSKQISRQLEEFELAASQRGR